MIATSCGRVGRFFRLLCALGLLAVANAAFAAEYRGQVVFGGLPLPGATVTVVQGEKKLTAITDQQGVYRFADLADGSWTIDIEMLCFAPIKQAVTVGTGAAPAAAWEMKLLSLAEIRETTKPVLGVVTAAAPVAKSEPVKPADGAKPGAAAAAPTPPPPPPEIADRASDGLLINGSVNNAATSQYSLAQAFGNNRNGGRSLYNFGLALNVSNSALNAQSYSLTGVSTPKPEQSQITATLSAGGPIKIPHLVRNGPYVSLVYQWTRNSTGTTQNGLFPTEAERDGDLSQLPGPMGQPVQFVNPATGLPFVGNVPVSPQAEALLKLYPMPNITSNLAYNYQQSIVSHTHVDDVLTNVNKQVGTKNNLYGSFRWQSTRTDTPNLFNFVNTSNIQGLSASANWSRTLPRGMRATLGYQFSRLATRSTPYWENRQNISGDAGITGNNQDPQNWGPPTLGFNSGFTGLSDGSSSFNRNETNALTAQWSWYRGKHYWQAGMDFRRQEFNYLSQANPRGTFGFTGAATAGSVNGAAVAGSDFADFLIGVPDTSAVAFGNADKYLRQSVYHIYAADDWRIGPQITANVSIHWEYSAPITELKNRLVNLDVTPGFTAIRPVLASSPVGELTGDHYPTSLMRPVKNRIEPRVGLTWRPLAGSSLVVSAGYGVYTDTSVYQTTALSMAQQAPLSKSLQVQNSADCPLTLANGFNPCSSTTTTTFAVDPNFRVGYAQIWQLQVRRDLPFSLQMTATYQGVKGTRGMQEFYPNTYPVGATDPCPLCPSGFAYRTSNGNSTREAGSLQLRRRLRSGFTAAMTYTYSKSIDDDSALGGQGPVVSGGGAAPSSLYAQDWRNLKAERGLSSFDQRHLLNVQLQYTTGMGMGGRTLMSGWRGKAFKEWTIVTSIKEGTGLPETPIYPEVVPGTGTNSSIRPDYTGAPIYTAPAGYHLNSAAFTAPAAGQWGNARKNSITGPNQFSMDASMSRTFRLKDRYNLQATIIATNPLNHPTYASWITNISSAQFGTPLSVNGMRSVQLNLRLRY